MKKVVALIIAVALLMSGCTAWEDVFAVDYVGYEPNYGDEYYKYEITNISSQPVKDVYVVVSVESYVDGNIRFTDRLSFELKQGETITYYLEVDEIYSKCEELGFDTSQRYWYKTANIVGFEWS